VATRLQLPHDAAQEVGIAMVPARNQGVGEKNKPHRRVAPVAAPLPHAGTLHPTFMPAHILDVGIPNVGDNAISRRAINRRIGLTMALSPGAFPWALPSPST
jgi:hypothetical protein